MSERRRRVGLGLLLAVLLGLALAGPAPAVVGGAPARQSEEDLQLPEDPSRDPQQTRERAEEILRGDEYQEPEVRDRSVLDRVREWLGDRLPEWSGPGTAKGFDVVAYIVFGVVVVGALGALTFVVARTRGSRRAPVEEADADVDVTPLRTPDEWDEEAARCEQAGDHRGAVRARFRALTTNLARRDLVADTPGRTAGELRTDVADRAPDLTPAFGAVADLFERVWFGGATAGPEQSTAARDLVRSALAAAPRRPRAEPSATGDGDDR